MNMNILRVYMRVCVCIWCVCVCVSAPARVKCVFMWIKYSYCTRRRDRVFEFVPHHRAVRVEYSQVFDESEIEFPGKTRETARRFSSCRASSEIQVDGHRRSNGNNGLSSSRLSDTAEMGASATRCSVKFNSFQRRGVILPDCSKSAGSLGKDVV